MASLMSDFKNPFLKDYSATSILKKNYDILLIQSQVKENHQNYHHQYKKQPKNCKQNIPTSSQISNPFTHKSINAYELLHQNRGPHNLKISDVRSVSQSRSMFGSLEKNLFYKGLEDLSTKQIMKNDMQRQARQQLKHYGADSLRYQYVATEYSVNCHSQQKQNPYMSVDRKSSKRIDSSKQIQTAKWNINISSEYYGYDRVNERKDNDDFPIQKLKKPSIQTSFKDKVDKNKNQRHSYYGNIANIPQDRNQDFQTAHHIKLKPNSNQQDIYKTSEYPIPSQKRLSIEKFNQNFHPQSSASSGFGYSSEMYESGANFMTKLGKNKPGPLDTNAFDEDKGQQQDFDLDQFQDIDRKPTFRLHSDTLEYNNKIYFQIPL